MPPIKIIGAGLAGSEAAWQCARQGLDVELFEMRPVRSTPAHQTTDFAELVCSNSLKSDSENTAPWLLKEEMRRAGSLLLQIARELRDEQRFQSGRKITAAPQVFLGAAENPSALPHEWRAHRLAKKVAVGAQFIQTQYCYDLPLLRTFMAQVEALGLIGKVYILIGVGPLRSAKAAQWMREHVPGLFIPDALIERLRGAQDQAREGRNICVELIEQIRQIRGISGVHVMAYRQEESVAEVIDRSGVLKDRSPWFPSRGTPKASQRTA